MRKFAPATRAWSPTLVREALLRSRLAGARPDAVAGFSSMGQPQERVLKKCPDSGEHACVHRPRSPARSPAGDGMVEIVAPPSSPHTAPALRNTAGIVSRMMRKSRSTDHR